MPITVHEKFNHSVLSQQKTSTFENYFKTNFPECAQDLRKSTDVAGRHREILQNKGVKILEKGVATIKGEKQSYSIDPRTSVGTKVDNPGWTDWDLVEASEKYNRAVETERPQLKLSQLPTVNNSIFARELPQARSSKFSEVHLKAKQMNSTLYNARVRNKFYQEQV